MSRILDTLGPVILILIVGIISGMAISECRFQSKLQTATRKADAAAKRNKDLYHRTVTHLKAANSELSEFGKRPFAIPGYGVKHLE